MEVIVTGKHIDITAPIREYAESKANKLPRYFDRIQSIEVIVDRGEHNHYEVEFLVHAEHHEPFVARGRNMDLYACIDEVFDKMERQLTDFKEKLRNRKHPASR